MWQRVFLLIPTVLLVLFVSGCGRSQRDVEKSIREEMKSSMGVTITSFDLKKQDNGSYLGTATAENGDQYDVTTTPPKDNKIEWKAIPAQGLVEKTIRAGLEQQLSAKVKTLQITKNGPGIYTGTAELETGAKVSIKTSVEGKEFRWEAKPLGS